MGEQSLVQNGHSLVQLIDENVQLKNYIEELSKECLDLNAALFEEANKLTRSANISKIKAEKQAFEKLEENGVLRAEVDALKSLLREQDKYNYLENSIVKSTIPTKSLLKSYSKTFPWKESTRTPPLIKFVSTERNNRKISTGTKNLIRPLPLTASNSDLSTSVINLATQKPVTRTGLFDALFGGSQCAENVNCEVFQEFLEWLSAGCPMMIPEATLPSQQPTQPKNLGLTVHQKQHLRFPINRLDESGDSDIDEPGRKIEDTLVEPNPSIDEDSGLGKSPSITHKTPGNTCPPPQTSPGTAFLNRLYREDLSACFDFPDATLRQALLVALPNLAIELQPLDSTSLARTEECKLIPGQTCSFELKIEIRELMKPTVLIMAVSSCARQHIAAAADLFQYMSLIRRGLAGSSLKPPTQASPHGERQDPVGALDSTHRNQFANIQRRRLSIALARLGFGLPQME